jgi:hypothetical protein
VGIDLLVWLLASLDFDPPLDIYRAVQFERNFQRVTIRVDSDLTADAVPFGGLGSAENGMLRKHHETVRSWRDLSQFEGALVHINALFISRWNRGAAIQGNQC